MALQTEDVSASEREHAIRLGEVSGRCAAWVTTIGSDHPGHTEIQRDHSN